MIEYNIVECPHCSKIFNFRDYIYNNMNHLNITTMGLINSVKISCNNCNKHHMRVFPNKLLIEILQYNINLNNKQPIIEGR